MPIPQPNPKGDSTKGDSTANGHDDYLISLALTVEAAGPTPLTATGRRLDEG